jgi:hypothetical protein
LLFSLLHLLLRSLVRLVACTSNELNSEIDVVVLRHQLMVVTQVTTS